MCTVYEKVLGDLEIGAQPHNNTMDAKLERINWKISLLQLQAVGGSSGSDQHSVNESHLMLVVEGSLNSLPVLKRTFGVTGRR